MNGLFWKIGMDGLIIFRHKTLKSKGVFGEVERLLHLTEDYAFVCSELNW